jgi:hypothetical protein
VKGARGDERQPHRAHPPSWAEDLLRLLLEPEHRESVSGDLLEEYRAGVVPARGRVRADLWYLRQVMGFVWRAVWLWAALLTASVIGRDALDWWLSPTNEFYARSIASTAIAVGLFASAGAPGLGLDAPNSAPWTRFW